MVDKTGKLFTNGSSQGVRRLDEHRFEGDNVFSRDYQHGDDVAPSRKPATWDQFFALQKQVDVPKDFMGPTERDLKPADRDPFKGWKD